MLEITPTIQINYIFVNCYYYSTFKLRLLTSYCTPHKIIMCMKMGKLYELYEHSDDFHI